MQTSDQAVPQPDQLSSSGAAGVFYLTGLFFLGFLARLFLGPLMPVIEKDLAFSHTQAGTIFFCISSGYTFTLLFSGFIASKLDHRRTILCSGLGILCATLIMANAHSLAWLRIGALVAGMAAGIYFPSGLATITNLVPRRKVGWALGIHEMAPNLSFVVAPLMAEGLLLFTSWRGAPVLLFAMTVVMLIVFMKAGPGRGFKGEALKISIIKELATDSRLWGTSLVISLGVATSLGTFSMLPLYLVFEQDVERTTVNLILPIARLLCLGPAFAAGLISDRIGAVKTVGIFLGLTGLATIMLGLAHGNLLWVMIFVQPLATVCLFAPSFSLLALDFDPRVRNVAVALATGVSMVVGTGLFPIGIGYLGEKGHFDVAFMSLGACCLAGLLALIWLNKRQTKGPSAQCPQS